MNCNECKKIMTEEADLVVSELYSPPGVTQAARMIGKLGINPGLALDIATNDENGQPWDFSQRR